MSKKLAPNPSQAFTPEEIKILNRGKRIKKPAAIPKCTREMIFSKDVQAVMTPSMRHLLTEEELREHLASVAYTNFSISCNLDISKIVSWKTLTQDPAKRMEVNGWRQAAWVVVTLYNAIETIAKRHPAE